MGLMEYFYKKFQDDTPRPTHCEDDCYFRENFDNFDAVTGILYKITGIADLDQRAMSLKQIRQHAIQHNLYSTQELLRKMSLDSVFLQQIIEIVTINETYFFREMRELDWLCSYIKNTHKRIKILSLPCSSGEEVFSILILLQNKGVDLESVDIYGYDIDSRAITKAKEGLYSYHATHKVSFKDLSMHFEKTEFDRHKIKRKFQKYAHFEQKNIFDLEGSHSRFDIIVTRNMFIYFDEDKRKKALEILVSLLYTDGILIKGHADVFHTTSNLESIGFGIYKKIY